MKPDRVDDATVWATACWWTAPRPLRPYLKSKFMLTDEEALTVIRAAYEAIAVQRRAYRADLSGGENDAP